LAETRDGSGQQNSCTGDEGGDFQIHRLGFLIAESVFQIVDASKKTAAREAAVMGLKRKLKTEETS
jgi:hypothetical protein